ncbi:MAG: phytanoyl-CoA dioxygenase family protein [Gemmatimonadota bacterium]|nr:phytanoyl-CoA dioxygenase family protein [Gemmatimonadota bacterium]
MALSAIQTGERFTDEETEHIRRCFHRDGYYAFGRLMEDEEVEALRADMQRKWDDPRMHEPARDQIRGTSLMRMFEYSYAFRDLIVREPFASLAEAILGDDCHCMSQNALYTPPNPKAVEDGPGGWHLDDLVHFPLPDGVPRHDPAVPPPCFVLQIFTPLTDVEAVCYGPTQVVPGSHFAGRQPHLPHEQDRPTFDGNGPHSFLVRKGDAYLFNNQVWHRGAPNASDRTRLMAGVTYSKRFIAQKFHPFIDYRMPDHVWAEASPRLQRMLGRHSKGAYG